MSKKRSLYELRGYTDRGGYVYALLYSNGIVQVGRTDNAREHVTARRRELRTAGLDLTDWWVSIPHAEWGANEQALLETCRVMGERTGRGCFSGINFAILCGKGGDLLATSTGARADIRRRRNRESGEKLHKRMAIAARYHAEGMTLRQIAGRLSVSHQTVSNDLARWEQVKDSMPLDIVRLSRPVNQPRQTDPAGGAYLTSPVDSGAAPVIPFRRPA